MILAIYDGPLSLVIVQYAIHKTLLCKLVMKRRIHAFSYVARMGYLRNVCALCVRRVCIRGCTCVLVCMCNAAVLRKKAVVMSLR